MRNTRDLRAMLKETLLSFIAGDVSAKHASTVARLATSIVGTLRVERDAPTGGRKPVDL